METLARGVALSADHGVYRGQHVRIRRLHDRHIEGLALDDLLFRTLPEPNVAIYFMPGPAFKAGDQLLHRRPRSARRNQRDLDFAWASVSSIGLYTSLRMGRGWRVQQRADARRIFRMRRYESDQSNRGENIFGQGPDDVDTGHIHFR